MSLGNLSKHQSSRHETLQPSGLEVSPEAWAPVEGSPGRNANRYRRSLGLRSLWAAIRASGAGRKRRNAVVTTPQMTSQRGKPHSPAKYKASAEVKAWKPLREWTRSGQVPRARSEVARKAVPGNPVKAAPPYTPSPCHSPRQYTKEKQTNKQILMRT